MHALYGYWSGYGGGLDCTWHVHCAGDVVPTFILTQLHTKPFDTVLIFDPAHADTVSPPPTTAPVMLALVSLTGALEDQAQTIFQPTQGTELSIVFRTEQNFEASNAAAAGARDATAVGARAGSAAGGVSAAVKGGGGKDQNRVWDPGGAV
eukprot:SAG11_NODE_1816_length_4215_cov_2.783042_1_plen_151_part_00